MDAALSSAPVMLPIPLITWSRLIFFPMLFTLLVSLSAPVAASCALVFSPFSAACASYIPACAFIIVAYILWYA